MWLILAKEISVVAVEELRLSGCGNIEKLGFLWQGCDGEDFKFVREREAEREKHISPQQS